jgi:transcriptional regulator with XRE-family HTH domain
MTIGEKIKLARNFRGLTQKELGMLVNLNDVRIRQYEIDARTPKESQLIVIASALDVPINFFREHFIDTYDDIMHMLFELDLSTGITVHEVSENHGLTTKYAISFNNSHLNSSLGTWHKKTQTTRQELATADDNLKPDIERNYLGWKLRYPISQAEECESRLKNLRIKTTSQQPIDEEKAHDLVNGVKLESKIKK